MDTVLHKYGIHLKDGTILIPTCKCCLHIVERVGVEWHCVEGCRCMMMGCCKPSGVD